jgi:hypothetical protein
VRLRRRGRLLRRRAPFLGGNQAARFAQGPGLRPDRPFQRQGGLRDAEGDFQKQGFKTHLADVITWQTLCDTTALQPIVDRIKAGRAATA